MQFGDLIIDEEPAADYLGKLNTGTLPSSPAAQLEDCSSEVPILWSSNDEPACTSLADRD